MRITRKRWHRIPWRKLNKRGKAIRILIPVLAGLCVALVVISVNMFAEEDRLDDQARQETQALLIAAQTTATLEPAQTPDTKETPLPTVPSRPAVLQDVDGYSVIAKVSIEKLELELPILSQATDDALKLAPCLFIGPQNPNDVGNMVITGHNNKDGSQFGRLKELKEGDIVTLMDKWGDTFTYEVYDIETIKPDDMASLEEYEGERALALVTCTSNGNSRLLLRCRLVEG